MRWFAIAVLAAAGVGAIAPGARGAALTSSPELANRCVAIESVVGGRFVAVSGADSYRAEKRDKRRAAFHLKPTGLGTYLLHDRGGRLLSAAGDGRVERRVTQGRSGEWSPRRLSGDAVAIRSSGGGKELAVSARAGTLIVARSGSTGRRALFRFLPKRDCRRFPEAHVGAARFSTRSPPRRGTPRGFADLHLHITADMRAGARTISGRAFHRFGISRALRARDSVLALAARRGYPLVSSRNGTGGHWTPAQLRRLYALGGMAAARLDTATGLVRDILRLERYEPRGRRLGVAVGTDVGGFSALPGPRSDAPREPLRYPFTLGGFRFLRQRTGGRPYDLNTDGVAHYGLVADLLADARARGGRRALRALFGSADAYLRMWRRAAADAPTRRRRSSPPPRRPSSPSLGTCQSC